MKNEVQDDGYETCGGDILTPNSHSNLQLTPQHHHYNMHQPQRNIDHSVMMPKHITSSIHDDPYNFVDDETNTVTGNMDHNNYQNHIEQLQNDKSMLPHDLNNIYTHHRSQESYAPPTTIMPSHTEVSIVQKKRGRKKKSETDLKQDMNTSTKTVKERKKHDKFNGMSEDEVSKRTLPDHLANNLDIIIVS